IAILLVSTGVWLLHAWSRPRDERAGPLDEAADWLTRFYVLAAAATGALLLLFGLSDLLALAAEAMTHTHVSLTGDNVLRGPVADALGRIITGLIVWGLHWGFVVRLTRSSGWRSAHLLRSELLYVYVYALALVGVLATLLFTGSA